jgi:hypothetical protein
MGAVLVNTLGVLLLLLMLGVPPLLLVQRVVVTTVVPLPPDRVTSTTTTTMAMMDSSSMTALPMAARRLLRRTLGRDPLLQKGRRAPTAQKGVSHHPSPNIHHPAVHSQVSASAAGAT